MTSSSLKVILSLRQVKSKRFRPDISQHIAGTRMSRRRRELPHVYHQFELIHRKHHCKEKERGQTNMLTSYLRYTYNILTTYLHPYLHTHLHTYLPHTYHILTTYLLALTHREMFVCSFIFSFV